jgi:F0F1-type ATP synthase assembly protein I
MVVSAFGVAEEPLKVPQDRKDRGGDWANALRDVGPYLSIGTSLAATVLAGLGLGYWVDKALGTKPVFFLIGSGLGLFAALYQFFLTVNRKP